MKEQKKPKKSVNKITVGEKRSKLVLKGSNTPVEFRTLLKDPLKGNKTERPIKEEQTEFYK